ncbi:MAG: IS91 family transposase [Gallionella sp.]|nr:IS91 family transposase [Gallionella sp.]
MLATFGTDYLATHSPSSGQAKVWRAIVACRTAALGGHVESCDVCGTSRHVYHSCRNRHCPTCQTRAKEAWLAARRRELLPVPYFHLVFTLPHALHGLVAGHSRRIYETLFAAASATLTEFAANPRHLGGAAAFTLVLHTWKQDLGRHVHVHALVAGGALTATGEWVSPRRGFLFPVKALSRVFRGKFVAALTEQRAAGQLPTVAGDTEWQRLKAALYAHEWVVYAKQPLGGPEQVLEYLGRYTHRVAISNERIVDMDRNEVAFRVRADAATGKKRTVRLAGGEFIDRFLTHVLPLGFKRIRHYGLLAPGHKTKRLALARAALDVPAPDPAVIESVAQFMQRVARIEWGACSQCGKGHFVVTGPLAPVRAPGASSRGPPCA